MGGWRGGISREKRKEGKTSGFCCSERNAQSMDHSEERIQDLDFPVFGQLDKLGVVLFMGNSLQALVLNPIRFFSAMAMTSMQHLVFLVLPLGVYLSI